MHHFEICNRDLDNFNVSNFGYDKRSLKKDHIKKIKKLLERNLKRNVFIRFVCL